MARRALLTESEREAISKPESRDNPYVAVSRVRKKINEELTTDVEVLREHHPDLLEELRDVVCEDGIVVSDSSKQPVEEDRRPEAEPVAEPDVAPVEDAALPETLEDALEDVEFPATKDRETCVDAVRAAYEYLQKNGTATMREFVTEVMPENPVGYDVPDLEPGERYRGAWWRRVVKPGLTALSDVESPSRGGSDWKYVEGDDA